MKQFHTQTLCSLQGRTKACLSVGNGGLVGGQQAAQPSGLAWGLLLGWKSWVKANAFFCLKSPFPGKRQLSSFFPALASSRPERTRTSEMPGPPVIRTGRK